MPRRRDSREDFYRLRNPLDRAIWQERAQMKALRRYHRHTGLMM